METLDLKQEGEKFVKKEIKNINDSHLTIYWWNFGKKTKSFDAKVSEYLKENGIVIKVKRKKDSTNEYVRDYKVSFTFGSMVGLQFTVSNYFDAVQKAIFFQLAHLGDKSKFSIDNREYSVNYHR